MARYIDFTAARDGLAELSRKIVQERQKWDRGRVTLGRAHDAIGGLDAGEPAGYRELLQIINDEAAAHPDDPAWQDLKRERDKIVADGVSTFATMSAKINAFDNA